MNNRKDELSPFEFKNKLIEIACSHNERLMLNAGRGNPNFLATMPRHAFLYIGHFALQEAERSYGYLHSDFGGVPDKKGIVNRFDAFLVANKHQAGISLLDSALSFALDHLGIAKSDFLYEMVEAYLGCYYPFPPRMLKLCEQIVKIYIALELCGTTTLSGNFDLFATEGGTAAMTYFFQTVSVNGLLNKGEKIAIITPIFSPYLEIPHIPQYDFEVVYLKANEEQNWQLPLSEIKKLEDKKIKLLCMVNPSNPPSVKMSAKTLDNLSQFINEKRRDLMVVSDDVYATFSDNFKSIFASCPYNTLCVYSFSKYFGCTGWRLGVMALNQKNVFDEALQKLPQREKKRLQKRYASLTPTVDNLKFIDRLVADSRTVALNHTSGLSGPQQLQMTLFALFDLLDEQKKYRKAAKRLIRRRYEILYKAIGYLPEADENGVDYYTIIDLEDLSQRIYNKAFSNYIVKKISAYDFLTRLADETGVVLLPGKGFEIEHPSARVSLANLTEFNYRSIGLAVKKILDEYFLEFSKKPN